MFDCLTRHLLRYHTRCVKVSGRLLATESSTPLRKERKLMSFLHVDTQLLLRLFSHYY